MPVRRFWAVALLLIPVAAPALAQSPAQSYVYQQRTLRHACRPPLKFAAGACVRRCPAGYRDEGQTCRLSNQRMR